MMHPKPAPSSSHLPFCSQGRRPHPCFKMPLRAAIRTPSTPMGRRQHAGGRIPLTPTSAPEATSGPRKGGTGFLSERRRCLWLHWGLLVAGAVVGAGFGGGT